MKRMLLAVPAVALGLLLGCQGSARVPEPGPAPVPEKTQNMTSVPDRPDFSEQERFLVPVEFLDPKVPAAQPEPLAAPLGDGGQATPQAEPSRPGLVWVPPHQVWRHGEWIRVPGQWLKPPQGSNTYVLGYRKEVDPGRYTWVPGHWR